MNCEGNSVKALDNWLWRENESVVVDAATRERPDLFLLHGLVPEAAPYMQQLSERLHAIHPDVKQEVTGDWSQVPKIRRLKNVGVRKLPRIGPSNVPYPQYGWLNMEPYWEKSPLPYGEKPETWKHRVDVWLQWWGKPFPAKYIVDELTYFRLRHEIDGVRFIGFPFSNIQWAYEFRKLLRRSDLSLCMSFVGDIDVHAIDAGRVRWARDNNFVALRILLRSASEFIGTQGEALAAALDVCHALNVAAYVEFKVGWFEDKVEDYLAAVQFCKNHELECRPQRIMPHDALSNATQLNWSKIAEPTNLSNFRTVELLGLVQAMKAEDEEAIEDYLRTGIRV